MSNPTDTEAPAPEAATSGFTPAGDPPQLSEAPAEAVAAITTPPAAEAHPPVAAPAPAPSATPAKPNKLQQLQDQMESVAALVLDAGEIAGRSAQAAIHMGNDLKAACAQIEQATQNGHKRVQWLLIGAASAMVLAVFFFLIMGVRMVSRINQLDVMVTEVGKKVIELNAGMESLETVNATLTEMAQRQEALRQTSTELEGRIAASLKQSEALVQQVPSQTAQQVAATSENLMRQVQGLNTRLQSQSSAVQALGKDVAALKGSVGNVDKLNRDVQALVTLQRERYLEALQKNQASAAAAAASAREKEKEREAHPSPPREKPLQYPRPQPNPPSPNAGGG